MTKLFVCFIIPILLGLCSVAAANDNDGTFFVPTHVDFEQLRQGSHSPIVWEALSQVGMVSIGNIPGWDNNCRAALDPLPSCLLPAAQEQKNHRAQQARPVSNSRTAARARPSRPTRWVWIGDPCAWSVSKTIRQSKACAKPRLRWH